MIDEFYHKGRRRQMVLELQELGIKSKKVLKALEKIPRHLFLESAFEKHAYEIKAFPIGAGQTISSPMTVAVQSSLLDLKKGEKVLEIGTGSGYQTAVLCELGVEVYSIERQKELFDKTSLKLREMRFFPKNLTYGDGYKGLPSFSPFDKIIITAGANQIPKDLLLQLKVGGKMVIPLGDGNIKKMTIVYRESENNFKKEEIDMDFEFVPFLRDKE